MPDRRRMENGLNDAVQGRRPVVHGPRAGRLYLTLACLLVLCAGCAPTIDLSRPLERDTLGQVADGTPGEGPAVISRIQVEDARAEQFPEIVAVLTDQYGNPQVNLLTRRPLAEEVVDRIEAVLRQRGLFAPNGPDTLLVRIVRLRGVERIHAEAVVALTYRLFDAAGEELFVGTSDVMESGARVADKETYVSYLGRYAYPGLLGPPGPFPTTGKLRAVTDATLERAIDQMVDNPDLRTALRRDRPAGPGG